MRIIVMFDLPMKTKPEIKEYTKFKKFLEKDGYIMIQYSVYSRFCRNPAAVEKHKNRVFKNNPENGNIRMLVVTEKQYLRMDIVLGGFTQHELMISKEPIIEV